MLQLLIYSSISLFGGVAEYVALEEYYLDLNTGSATYKLCGLGPRSVTSSALAGLMGQLRICQ